MKQHRYQRATTILVYIKTFTICDTYNTHITKNIVHTTYHKNDNNNNNDNNKKERNKEDADDNENHLVIMMKMK